VRPPTATQPPRRVTWRPRPSRDDHKEGVPARPPGRVPATTTPPHPPDPRPRKVFEVGPRTGSGSPHPRVALCPARSGVSRPPHPREACRPDPSPWAQTHTLVSLPLHVCLRDSSPPPRDVTLRASCDAVSADSFPLPPHDVPSLPPWCPSLLASFGPRGPPFPPSSTARPPPLPSTARGPGGRPTPRRPRPCRLLRWPTRR